MKTIDLTNISKYSDADLDAAFKILTNERWRRWNEEGEQEKKVWEENGLNKCNECGNSLSGRNELMWGTCENCQ